MSDTVAPYRWSASEFVRAWEAGAFDHRVELIEGEVWPVFIGDWHGLTVSEVNFLLRNLGLQVRMSTLPSGSSLPDPDCWVARPGAEPASSISRRLSSSDPSDVLLVVEVSDETLMADLDTKVRVYGSAGWSEYWVISPEAVYVHTGPHPGGYRNRTEYRTGERVPVPFADATIAVDDLIGVQNLT